MKKKLLAVAVAGALAAPGVAMAQSSVTISGVLKASLQSMRIGSKVAAANASETRIADDSSAIRFNVVEDLGGGLKAIGQVDLRVNLTSGVAGAGTAANGNNHVGLQSNSLGRIFIGRQDLHYGATESDMATLGDLRSNPVSLISSAGAGAKAIAVTSRTAQVIHYTTPNFGGFTAIVAYATNGENGLQTDSTTAGRKGNTWNLNPQFAGSNFTVGWTYYRTKNDLLPAGGAVTVLTANGVPAAAGATAAGTTGTAIANGDQKSNRLYGSFKIAGFKLGLAWDKSTITNAVAGGNLSERTAWSFPASYTMGNNQFHAHYTKANTDKVLGAGTGAKMFAMSYAYTLSKRTSVALTYAKITNDAAAGYNFFTGTSLGNSPIAAAAGLGEDPRLLSATVRHTF